LLHEECDCHDPWQPLFDLFSGWGGLGAHFTPGTMNRFDSLRQLFRALCPFAAEIRSPNYFHKTFRLMSCAPWPVRCNDDMTLTTEIERKTLMKITTIETTIKPLPCARGRGLMAPTQTLVSDVRAYLRRLRAAEMAAWERSGGDYLLSQPINPAESVAMAA
jgi:hypothetical protein